MGHTPQNPVPLAVVGISCRYPGDATNPEKLWDLIANRRSGWTKVPEDRWNEEAFYHPDPDDSNGTHNSKGGHFINQDLGLFDAGFFNVTPQEAAAMDPQQRLLLEVVYEGLENAGIKQENIRQSNTAVFMALFARDYDRNLYKDMASLPKYQMTGTGDSILANRISHLFDLAGPSVTVDTACSGGMAAIAQAAQVLRSGQSDLALAGAANLILTPDMLVGMSNLHMLNAEGRSWAFDERGAGYGRGEGVATLVLKRLDDAIRDGDPIRAVIRDAALNQDGHTAGITLPSGAAQEALERQVWKNIGVDPGSVGYIEAHGTGTLAGDKAELESISRVFCHDRDPRDPLIVGSIKSNIGHTESASGLAAIIKSTMIFEKGVIPPNVNFDFPRQSLEFEKKKIQIPVGLMPWKKSGVPRISINNFGYGGTNAHVILEAPPKKDKVAATTEDTARLFVLSANSQASLQDTINRHKEWLTEHGTDQSSLRDLAYTLSQRRSILPWRATYVASNQTRLLEALEQSAKKADSLKRIPANVKVSFVFTGQGAQWAGMGKELLSEPTFGDSIQKSRRILLDLGCSWDLVEELVKNKKESRLKEAELAQPSTTAIQIALVELARRWGIVPESVVGHSSGEIGAAYAAGYLDQYQAMKVAYVRGFSAGISKSKGLGDGGMLAVGVGEDDIAPYLAELTKGKAVVACQNSPSSTTISGDVAALDELSEALTKKSIFNRRLAVDTAYHSHHMQAAATEYREGLGNDTEGSASSSGVKFFSSVSGELKTGGFDPDYWTANLVSRVRFCDALQTLCQSEQSNSRATQQRIFIEMGPHAALAGPARQSIAGLSSPFPNLYISALVRDTSAAESSLAMAGSVFTQGYPIDLAEVCATDATSKDATTLSNLPTYAWDHTKRHWHESRLSRDHRFRKHPYHDLLGLRMIENNPLRPSWRHMLGVEGLPWLRGHVIDGLMIFPGAGYMCMAMEGAAQLAGDRFPGQTIERMWIKDIFFLKGLVIPEGRTRIEVQLAFSPIPALDSTKTMEHNFSITAYTGDAGNEQWNEHSRGKVIVEFATNDDQKLLGTPVSYGELVKIADNTSGKDVTAEDVYEQFASTGNGYGPTFVGITDFYIAPDLSVSRLEVSDVHAVMPSKHMRPHFITPSTLDIVLQTSLPLVSQAHGAGAVMPVHIDSMAVSANIGNKPGTPFKSIATLTSSDSRARAADTNIMVFPDGDDSATPVIEITRMELRSLGHGDAKDAGAGEARDIGHTMEWATDETFVTAKQLKQASESAADETPLARTYGLMSQFLKHKTFKQSGLRVLELGGATGAAARAFVEALQALDAEPAAYDWVAKDISEDVQTELKDLANIINFRQVDIQGELEGFEPNSYDVIFTSNGLKAGPEAEVALSNARKLLKAGGVFMLVTDTESTGDWKDSLSDASFKAQLIAHDDDSSPQFDFVVARLDDEDDSDVTHVRLISASDVADGIKTFVKDTSSALQREGMRVTASTWGKKHAVDDSINLVIDDGSNPIFSDIKQERLRQVIDLLQTPSKIIWVSVQDREEDRTSPRKHLITGVARSAHAENEDLDMITIDVQQTLAAKSRRSILKFVSQIIRSFDNANVPRERHYVYTGSDVLVPRVIPNDEINRQVSGKVDAIVKDEAFAASETALKLDTSKTLLPQPVFVENQGFEAPLEEDHVEIDTRAFALPNPAAKPSSTGPAANGYAGVITKTGSQVSGFKAGDYVVAVGPVAGGNRIRVSAAAAQRLSGKHSFADAAAFSISSMTAVHALVDIADVQPKQIVLVDGAATPTGQALISLARHLGAEVIAAVSRSDEAKFLEESLGVPASHIVPRESHLAQRQIQKLIGGNGLDVVAGCAKTPVTAETVQLLKPFGTLVHVQTAGSDSKASAAAPANVTASSFDFDQLLQAKPQKAAKLLKQTMQFISEGMQISSFKVKTHDFGDIKEALKEVQSDTIAKHVLVVEPASIARVARPSYRTPKLDSDVTYVVAGGLGDLGPRLLGLMAKAGAKHLVTLSRRGNATEKLAKVSEQLKAINSDVSLSAVQCDVSKEDSVRAALAEIKDKGLPPVKGVIQGAFMLKDCTLDTMTADIFNDVLHTKVAGTLNLQKVFAPEGLAFFITMSSIVNVVGTLGQANYNAGNSVQDALAQFSPSDDCSYLTLNIGIIEDAELNNATIVNSIRRQGLTLVSHDELNAYFEFALSADTRKAGVKQAVIGFTPDTILETTATNANAHTLMFTHARRVVKEDAEGGGAEQKKTFKDLLAEGADREEISAFVAQAIGDKLADLIGMSPADVDLGSSLSDLGLDSLVAIELRNWIMREYDSPLQSSEVLDSPDVWSMGQKVTQRSRIIGEATPASSTSSSAGTASAVTTAPTSRSQSVASVKRS